MEKIELTSFVRTTVLIIYISIWCTTQNMVLSMLKRKVFVNLVFVAVDWFSRLSITSSNATTKAIKKPPKIQIATFCAGRQWASIYYTTDLEMTTEGDWKWQAFHSLKHSEDETHSTFCRLQAQRLPRCRDHRATWGACTRAIRTTNSAFLSCQNSLPTCS